MSEPSISFREVARRWLIANALWILVAAIVELIQLELSALGFDDFVEAYSMRLSYAVVTAVVCLIEFAIFAALTAPVLRMIVPALSLRRWLAAHLMIGVLAGLFSFVALVEPAYLESIVRRYLVSLKLGVVPTTAILGAIIGSIIGGIQALALRPAALGLNTWVRVSAVAGILVCLTLLAGMALARTEDPLLDAVIVDSAAVVATGVGAVAMLLALRRLEPRGLG